jgi:hypothetical protein
MRDAWLRFRWRLGSRLVRAGLRLIGFAGKSPVIFGHESWDADPTAAAVWAAFAACGRSAATPPDLMVAVPARCDATFNRVVAELQK